MHTVDTRRTFIPSQCTVLRRVTGREFRGWPAGAEKRIHSYTCDIVRARRSSGSNALGTQLRSYAVTYSRHPIYNEMPGT